MKSIVVLAVLPLLVTVFAAEASDLVCSEPGQFDRAVSAESVTLVRIQTGSGILRVIGDDALDEIRVSGRACAREDDLLRDFGLDLEPVDSVLNLSDRLPEGANHPEAAFAKFHLTLHVPASLALEIETEREPVHITNVGSLKIDKRRGELNLDGVAGSARVRSMQGDLTIRNITGDLTLERDRGETIVENVGGNVDVLRAERGNSLFRNVGGNLTISSARGNIAAVGVGGNLVVRDRQEGDLIYQQVSGMVDVDEPTGIPEWQLIEEAEDDEEDEGRGPPHQRHDS